MTFDICFAAYNSEKWLKGCLEALSRLDYDKKQVCLYFADGASCDHTLVELERLKAEYKDVFGAFEILPQKANRGFGTASNRAAEAGSGEIVFYLNLDTKIFPDALRILEKEIRSSPSEWGAFELRQFPYEHPKYYNPVTMETSWASGAALAVRRTVLEQVGGFDESIFMYGEDVELSWRIRLGGYKIKYVPAACTWHYSYQSPNEVKPVQVVGSLASNLLLRYKYGTEEDIREWRRLMAENQTVCANGKLAAQLDLQTEKIEKNRSAYRSFYKEKVQKAGFAPNFFGFDYEFARSGAFYSNCIPQQKPAFTVIVRTYKRPQILALTLQSLRNQTYQNFKVVVVEDGENPQSEAAVQNAAQWLDIAYLPVHAQAGRCRAGNLGLRAVTTEYACFLDDDDYFFAEHFEVMANLIGQNPACGLFIAGAVEGSCKNAASTEFTFVRKRNNSHKELKKVNFFIDNPIPIQAAVFRTELARECGGLDETLDALEDWDFWMRMLCRADFAFTDKATSIYKVPAEKDTAGARDEYISKYRARVFEKMADYRCEIPAQDMLRLFWSPERQKEAEKQKKFEAELRDTAGQICRSRSWRMTAPLRILPAALCMLTGGLSAALKRLHEGALRLQAWAGPRTVDAEHAEIGQVHMFVQLSRRSLCWKVAQKLAGRRVHEQMGEEK